VPRRPATTPVSTPGTGTALVLLTRDLRVHDQPALHAAAAAGRVLPVFVFDDAILGSAYAAPNRLQALREALTDLRVALQARGGDLVVRRGRPAEVVRALVAEHAVTALHVSADVSAFARRREAMLAAIAADAGATLTVHPGVMLHLPPVVRATGGGHFKVFTPYWRRWSAATPRPVLPAPERVRLPDGVDPGVIPTLAELTAGASAPALAPAGERAARERLAWWLGGPVEEYAIGRNLMAVDGTSRLSVHLHLGCLSVTEIAASLDARRPGHEAFLQELCWRDFNHQLLDARPDLAHADVRTRGDRWRTGRAAEADVAAWREGRTGYPLVDAGMRQLLQEGWMHNRARMVTASFLTKHLYVDWRVGAAHFMHHLQDGDLASNYGQWQWTAGTGTDSRPNRMFNPVVQGERYDPDGTYVRRWVPELAGVAGRAVHQPRAATLFDDAGYPAPIVDHREARERFLTARGADAEDR
jgi:deoxyribodipyrimidine photo-lyase